MLPTGTIYGLNHNDDGSVTVKFRDKTETYSGKEEIAAIVKRMREQREAVKAAPLTFPSLLA